MFPELKFRSHQKEMMDAPVIPKRLMIRNLQELDFLNRMLGGHTITLQGIKQLVRLKDKQYHIADLGCGSGDTLKHIARWARMKGYNVKLTGIDINEDAIAFMEHRCRGYSEITGVKTDYRTFLETTENIDIIHCSLFCHHLTDAELTELIRLLKSKVRVGFIINDLQRTRLAWFAVRIFTTVLNGSELSRHDGPLSVLKGFTEDELTALMNSEDVLNYSISRKWAFRFLVIALL
jgi:2-polyprenyl-3-methyl-5-hydroxy-6-metoxy-1,4-benzoquinol methylase